MTSLVALTFPRRICKDEPALMAGFIRTYSDSAAVLYNDMARAARAGVVRASAAAAHDLRPQAQYTGAAPLVHLLVTIDQQARSAPPVPRIDLVEQALTMSEAPIIELRSVIRGFGAP